MDTDIKKAVIDANIGTHKDHSWLGNGFSSHAYEVTTDQGSFVLLQTKKNSFEQTNYKIYYANLRCLEKSGFTQAPKAVHVSDDGRTLIITKVEGTEITKLKDLSSEERRKIAYKLTDTLLALQAIKPDVVRAELEKLGVEYPEPIDQQKDWDHYVIDTFYPYKDRAPADAQTAWLEEQITSNQPMKTYGDMLTFHHGDTSGPNVLVDKHHNILLIDLGGAHFQVGAKDQEDFGLSYTMNHIPLMAERRDELIRYVADKQHYSYERFRDFVKQQQLEIKIADIAWAFMMYTRATAGEVTDKPETFKKILDRRIEEYKAEFLD